MSGDLDEAGLEEVCLEWLAEVGWQTAYGPDLAPEGRSPERQSYADVLLEGRLRQAIAWLNAELPQTAIDEVVATVRRPGSQSLISENWRVFELLAHGVKVSYSDSAGQQRDALARIIEPNDAGRNDLLAVNQLTVVEQRHTRRADIMLFVNGLPLGLIELKRSGDEHADLRQAYDQIRTYAHEIPALFAANAVCVIADGYFARMGTAFSGFEHFAPWKTVDGTTLAPPTDLQLETLIRGAFVPENFLDLVSRFVTYTREDTGVVKRLARYHQYHAVNKAVETTIEATKSDGRAGVVWHTQGSGKSFEMLFYVQKIVREPAMHNPTIVLVTDRNDLDDQLYGEVFTPTLTLPETPVQAESRAHLKSLLTRASGGIVFTTLQKFGLSEAEKKAGTHFPLLSDRRNIVVVVDEAHRSQYDFLDGFARHLRDALPGASYIGFTGTPIESTDKSTRAVFGDYIDVYDLTQAVQDEATVKVYYEPRLAKVALPEPIQAQIDDSFASLTEGLEDDEREKQKTAWARVEAVVGAHDRVAAVARDIVHHWEGRRNLLVGKAMVVGMSRRICVALYDEIVKLRPDWHTDNDQTGRIKVVITGSAADGPEMNAHIRDKARLRELKARAKDPDDELELVIVRDMWLTGFDSPSMHTMYVDKPMRGAGLMQAIARVNRTFRDKPAGLVVDYIGIAESLKTALADYTDRDRRGGEVGEVIDRAADVVLEKHSVLVDLLHGFDWRGRLAAGTKTAYLTAVLSAYDHLLGDPDLLRRFLEQQRRLVQAYTLCPEHERVRPLRDDISFFESIRVLHRKSQGDRADRTGRMPAEVETALRQMVSEAIASEGVVDIYAAAGLSRPDLSIIDEAFVERMHASPYQNLQLEMLRRLLTEEIRSLGERNVLADRRFSEMLERAMRAYTNRSLTSAEIVAALVRMARELQAEHARGAQLGLTDDELAFYDAVADNGSAVAVLGDDTLRLIARELVDTVRRNVTVDWTRREQVRAAMRRNVKRLLAKHGYPPDRQDGATALVLEQAEVLARQWAAA